VRHLAASTLVTTCVVVAHAWANLPVGRSDPYDRYCVACHGERGDGHGPAAPFTSSAPRDFTKGAYKWSSTGLGVPPTDADLATTIRFGAPGTSMPAFALSPTELADVIATVKAFDAPLFAKPAHAVAIGPTRPPNPERGAYLWSSAGCATCHGEDGKGSAIANPPYDLTAWPLRRPHEDDPRRAAATSIALGLTGTAMPGYLGQLPEADLWALADHVVALGAHTVDHATIQPAQLAADRAAPLATAIWPGTGDGAAVWGTHLAPQGTPPASLAPAEASLSAKQCGRCHAKQVREWTGSIHASAGSPGLYAQLDAGMTDTCRRCHAPLAEQTPGAIYQPELRDQGVTCAACHLRAWTRNGPPDLSPTLLAAPGYPRTERKIYERSDFCMPCHQLPPRNALDGKPLLDTYREWLAGPYMPRGIQCQHCHMPNREHEWRGVHDPITFAQGYKLDVAARRTATGASVVVDMRNVGAGHYLPTTPTPAVWLRIELIDAHDRPIEGARGELRIGRDIYYDGGWHERSDTRIPPGGKVTLAKAWRDGRVTEAVAARITVEVHPDDYYESFYANRLAGTPPTRALYEAALARAKSTHYVAERRDVALSSAR